MKRRLKKALCKREDIIRIIQKWWSEVFEYTLNSTLIMLGLIFEQILKQKATDDFHTW